jgi:hypothetical protein
MLIKESYWFQKLKGLAGISQGKGEIIYAEQYVKA